MRALSLTAFIACMVIILGSHTFGYAANPAIGYMLSDSKGNLLAHQNGEVSFVPASIIKLLTGLAALDGLKPGYRFKTIYYLDPVTKDLYIKGFGDPFFVSEVIERLSLDIGSRVKSDTIRHIVCDATYFDPDITIPGKGFSLNPYDSPVGALCANFNTINFKWDTSAGRFISAEPQTPLLDIFLAKIRQTGLKNGRILLSKEDSLVYPGLLIRYFLSKQMPVTGQVHLGRLPVSDHVAEVFLSPYTIERLIQKLLEFSNNFMANQLMLSLGASVYGAPATLEKGVNAVRFYAETTLGIKNFSFIEGSGLSRKNRLTPAQMMTVLNHFQPFYSMLNRRQNDFYKTGTLHGVRTRAGFLFGKDNCPFPYVIMINQNNKGYNHIYKKLVKKVNRLRCPDE